MESGNRTASPNSEFESCGLFLETNLARLDLCAELRETLRKHKSEGVEITLNDGGIPVLSVNGQNVYNLEDPLGVVSGQVDQVEFEDKTDVVVVFGLGLGYHAELMERRCRCHVVVYDPCLDALSTVLNKRALPLEQTTIVHSFGQLLGEVQPRLHYTDRKIIVVAMPEYMELFPDEFVLFKKMVEQAVDNSHIMERTVLALMKDWIKTTAKNMAMVAHMNPVDTFRQSFKGKPGILVSAGPSLDKNVEVLKDIKDNALVVAVNTAAKPLHAAGVVPDMVTIVESLDLSAHFRDIDWLDQVLLAPSMNCHASTYALPVKRIHPVADLSVSCTDWLAKAFGWHRFLAGGSVACTGFAILHELGCDPIILIGQDLAYTNGDTYAKGAAFGKLKMKLNESGDAMVSVERSKEREDLMVAGGRDPLTNIVAMDVEAYGGKGTVTTTKMFKLFQVWFEAAAETWAGDRTLVNATEGGARIEGFDEMSLLDVAKKWCKEPIDKDKLMDEAIANAPEPDMDTLIDVIQSELDNIEEMKILSKQTCKTAETAIEKLEKNKNKEAEKELVKLEAFETKIRSNSRRSPLLDSYVGSELNRLRTKRNDDKDDDKSLQTQNSLRRSCEIFKALIRNADELQEIFGNVIGELK